MYFILNLGKGIGKGALSGKSYLRHIELFCLFFYLFIWLGLVFLGIGFALVGWPGTCFIAQSSLEVMVVPLPQSPRLGFHAWLLLIVGNSF